MVQQQSAALWQVMAALQSKLGEVQGGYCIHMCSRMWHYFGAQNVLDYGAFHTSELGMLNLYTYDAIICEQ